MSQIRLGICNYDVSLKFPLSGIRQMFEEFDNSGLTEVTRETQSFGPSNNWSILFTLATRRDGEDKLGIYLQVGSQGPTSIAYTFTVTYLSKQNFFARNSPTSGVVFDGFNQAGYPSLLSRSQWGADATIQQQDALLVAARVYTPAGPRATSTATLGLLHKTLTEETPADLSFTAFSKRSDAGELSGPKKYLASSDVLQAANSYLGEWVQSKGQATFWKISPSACVPIRMRSTYTDPDSDFEDDFDDEDNVFVRSQAINHDGRDESPRHTSSVKPSTTRRARERLDSLSDIAWSDIDSINSPPSVAGTIFSGDGEASSINPDKNATTASSTAVGPAESTDQHTPCMSSRPLPGSEEQSCTVIVTGIAAKTWEAVLYYMYTGIITFAPLKSESEELRSTFVEDYALENPNRPAPCSCKSVYRVAKEMKMDHLQSMALNYLRSHLSANNVLVEYFSKFTAQYDEVKKTQFGMLAKHWDEIKASSAFQELLVDAVSGRRPHVGPAIAEIFQNMSLVKA